MKNPVKKIVIFISILAMCLSLVLSAPGTEMQGLAAGENEIPTATFTNEPDATPNLYIKIHLVSGVTGKEIPPEYLSGDKAKQFTFFLLKDGKPYGGEEFKVIGSNGTYVTDNSSSGLKDKPKVFTTADDGSFTLTAEQEAVFEYFGEAASYEISQQDIFPEFTQIDPAEGTNAYGTVPKGGSEVIITDQWMPMDQPETETTKLVITKAISYPAGFDVPAQSFDFQVTLDNGNESFDGMKGKVTDASGSNTTEVTTDADGRFTMAGGSTVVFEDVPSNVDYRIAELKPSENSGELSSYWRAVNASADVEGDEVDVRTGALKGAQTSVRFTDAIASFGVSKRMGDESAPDTSFGFLLEKSDGSVYADAAYLLYDLGGKRTDNEIHKTDQNGEFSLKADQTAMFIGIPENVGYQVMEKPDPEYIQEIPTRAAGYLRSVHDSVEMLPFVNRLAPNALSVTKIVTPADGSQMPVDDPEFTFTLQKDGQPVAGAFYSVGNSDELKKTDEKGTFSLKRNETARFESLASGDYTVTEGIQPSGYSVVGSDTQTVSFTNGESSHLEFENSYSEKPLQLKVVLTDQWTTPLADGTFGLYRDAQATVQAGDTAAYTTGSDGSFMETVLPGIYYLKQLTAPAAPEGYDGYFGLNGILRISIQREVLAVTSGDKTGNDSDAGSGNSAGGSSDATSGESAGESSDATSGDSAGDSSNTTSGDNAGTDTTARTGGFLDRLFPSMKVLAAEQDKTGTLYQDETGTRGVLLSVTLNGAAYGKDNDTNKVTLSSEDPSKDVALVTISNDKQKKEPGTPDKNKDQGQDQGQNQGQSQYQGPWAAAELSVTKNYDAWTDQDSFTFDLAPKGNIPMPKNTRAAATKNQATVSFETIIYNNPGVYNYTITEENPGRVDVDYDTASHKVTVTVVQDVKGDLSVKSIRYDGSESLTITNKHIQSISGSKNGSGQNKEGSSAGTGDASHLMLWLVLMLAAIGTIVGMIAARRKK